MQESSYIKKKRKEEDNETQIQELRDLFEQDDETFVFYGFDSSDIFSDNEEDVNAESRDLTSIFLSDSEDDINFLGF